MSYFTYTLVGDGASDRVLLPIIDWALRQCTTLPFSGNFVSYAELKTSNLRLKLERALAIYPCDLLFVHRDAERAECQERRVEEIAEACPPTQVFVPVVPVRMTEAWLLFNVQAIRRAADNPNGLGEINLPALRDVEGLPDAKETLFETLRAASGRTGRRLRKFNEGRARARLTELIDDFSPLRSLNAFSSFERCVISAVQRLSLGA
jgi:hypothetical protein